MNFLKNIFSSQKPQIERAAKLPKSGSMAIVSPVYMPTSNLALYSIYTDILQVRAIVNKLKDKYVSVPFLVLSKKTGQEVKKSNIKNILTTEVLESLFIDYLVLGNSYLYFYKSSKNYVESLKPMPGAFILHNVSNANDIMFAKTESYEITVGIKRKFDTSEVFHFSTPKLQKGSVYNPIGTPLLLSGNKSSTVLNSVYDSLVTIFQKRGAIGMIASKDAQIPITDPEAVLKSYYEKYGYGADKNSIMVTSEALEWIRMSLPINELTPVEIKDSEFRELCKLFNIDSVLLSDKTSSTYNNFETAQKSFVSDNIMPFLTKFYSELSAALDTDFEIVPDFTELREMQKDMKLLNEIYEKMFVNGVVTSEEWRTINKLQ